MRKMKQKDLKRIHEICARKGLPVAEFEKYIMTDADSLMPASTKATLRKNGRGMTIKQHRWFRVLIPIGLLVISAVIGVFVAKLFPEIKNIGTFIMFGGVVTGVLLYFLSNFFPIRCPHCTSNLKYYNVENSYMARYTCKSCGFKGR